MEERDAVRRRVADYDAERVARPGSDFGCCSGAEQKGVTAQVAGYGRDELESLPTDAVENSFGCGNPVAFAGVGEGDVVVDLGSGAGIDLLLAARKVGPEGLVIGIDMTDAIIDKARRNIAHSGLTNVEVRKGVIESLPVEAGSVDWVFSNCVINLSPDKAAVFAEVARVLKPGGRMMVSDIVVEDLPDQVRRDDVFYGACIAGAIAEDAYVGGLRRAGLVEVEVVERLVYEASQLEALVRSEVSDVEAESDGRRVAEIAEQIAGMVWSARFSAVKSA